MKIKPSLPSLYAATISPSCKEGVFFLLYILTNICLAPISAQKDHWLLRLQCKDNVYLELPVKLETNKITIPAYPFAIHYVSDFKSNQDSIYFSTSIYQNLFALKKQDTQTYSGVWIKYASNTKQYQLPCTLQTYQPIPPDTSAMQSFPHQWEIHLYNQTKNYTAIGTFRYYTHSERPHLSGSIATPYGDLGHLNGYIKNDSLFLSSFNGSFATHLQAKIFSSKPYHIDSLKGIIYYGSWSTEIFKALPNNKKIVLHNEIPLNELLVNPSFTLNPLWKDIDGNNLTLMAQKPLILLIMGTWCPNCADENKLFSEWYNSLSPKFQIIALSVERTQNREKAIELLKKYKQKLNIPFPIVLLSENGNTPPFNLFPELTQIPAFPTTIYFDKQHRPYKATMGFNGPSTHELYQQTQQHIQTILQELSP